jgi:hypothetical protein
MMLVLLLLAACQLATPLDSSVCTADLGRDDAPVELVEPR